MKKTTRVKVEISARHIHLSAQDLKKLFGPGYVLTPRKNLSQTGEFAAKEEVILKYKNGQTKARIVGPTREFSQIELTSTEAIKFDVDAPLRLSGNLKGAPLIKVSGPRASVNCPVIIAQRHLHCSPAEAKRLALKNNQRVRVKMSGERALVFENVLVRIKTGYTLAVHIDTDEANACGLGKICGYGLLF